MQLPQKQHAHPRAEVRGRSSKDQQQIRRLAVQTTSQAHKPDLVLNKSHAELGRRTWRFSDLLTDAK